MRKQVYSAFILIAVLSIAGCGKENDKIDEPVIMEEEDTSDPVAYDGTAEDTYLIEPEMTPESLWYDGCFRMYTDMGKGFILFLEKDGPYMAQGITSDYGNFIQMQDASTMYISINDEETEDHYKYTVGDLNENGSLNDAFVKYRDASDSMELETEGEFTDTYTAEAVIENEDVTLTFYVDKSTAGITSIDFPEGTFVVEPLESHTYMVSDFDDAEVLPKGQESEDKLVDRYIKVVLSKIASSQEELEELEEFAHEEMD